MPFSTWLWLFTVLIFLLVWWYRVLRRLVRYKMWRHEYLPWLDKVERERVKFDPKWPDVPSG